MHIFSFGLRTLPFEKFWLRTWLVKDMLKAECVGLHAIEETNFCNLNFIFRFAFDCSLVFDPLKSELTIHLGVVCRSPIDCTVYYCIYCLYSVPF